MCGITGVFHFDRNRVVDSTLLNKMCDAIVHRGPDDHGVYINENIGLGHRRLSIIDLNSGHQPMTEENNNFVITYNGEIYNYIELRDELKKLNHHFITESDTEVILKAYKQWGTACLEKLNGMFAFAIWDSKQKQLFLARDRMGEKPLYYAAHNNTFLFGSEIKCILTHGYPVEKDLSTLEIYLSFCYNPAPFTFYKGIKQLNAGHYLLVKEGNVKEIKYWDLPEIDENNMLTNKHEIYEQFSYLFKDSVRIRMRSDVPYGAFLSGGLDSSSIAVLMSDLSKLPVETFTIGYHENEFDESKLAKQVAVKFKTNHHEKLLVRDKLEEALQRVLHHFDEPFGDSSAMPTGYVSAHAREFVKMVLTGDGGDEVLSGYTVYQGEKFASSYKKLPSFVRTSLPGVTDNLSKLVTGKYRYKLNRATNVFNSSNLPFNDRLVAKTAHVNVNWIKSLLNGNIKEVISVEDYVKDVMSQCTYKDSFYKLMYFNLKNSLPGDMLTKVDRMSMSHSLETRIPFLDHRLVEFMVNVHKNVKLQGYERKSVLRNSVAKRLPQELLEAPKRGFGVPVRDWFKDDFMKAYSLELFELCNLGFDKKILGTIIDINNKSHADMGNYIWTLLVFSRWYKQC